MNILNILQEEALLLESGVRIPKGTKSVKILHHDDFDGVMSAVAMALQLKKQGMTKITTDILHDSDTEYEQNVKLAKRNNQMLVVVDFDRFKNKKLASDNIDFQSDHHEPNDKESKNSSRKAVGKIEFGSDVMHISTKIARGFFTGSDLAIMNGIDSAKFGGNLSTNIYLQRELKKNDGVQNKKMRLAIITSSLLGQLVRSSGSRNPGAIKSIINNLIESPSVLRFYTEVKKHIDLQKEQIDLLKAYEGKPDGEIDWDAIEAFNSKAPKEMKIGTSKSGTVKKGEQGRKEAAGESELAQRNKTGQAERDLDVDEKGNKSLKSKDAGDADLKPWEAKDKFNPIDPKVKSQLWKDAEAKAEKNAKGKWATMSAEEKKKKTVEIWKKSMNDAQKGSPQILRKTENVSKQTDMKGNRYLAYEDPKIVANIRDFWQFWQMAMRPDYYEKFITAAKAKGIDFKPEEIDLVDLGKKAMQMAKSEMFTTEELKKRGFDNPEKVLGVLNQAFDIAHAKSGGHKAITNIDLKPIFGVTATKYDDLAKRAKEAGREDLQKVFAEKAKKFADLLREFKERTQALLTQAVQGRVNRTKNSFAQSLKGDIVKNSK